MRFYLLIHQLRKLSKIRNRFINTALPKNQKYTKEQKQSFQIRLLSVIQEIRNIYIRSEFSWIIKTYF